MMKVLFFTKIKEFFIPISAIAAIIIITVFLLIPKVRQIYALTGGREKANKQIGDLSNKLLDLQTLSEAELFDSANLLLEALPAEKNFYKILSLMKTYLEESEVDLISFDFSPGVVEVTSDSQPMVIKISFSSTFAGLKAFSQVLEKSLPLMSIESLKLQASSTGSAQLQRAEGTMTIKSYFLPLPKSLGKVDQPLMKIKTEDLKLIEQLKSYYRRFYQTGEAAGEPTESVGRENPFP